MSLKIHKRIKKVLEVVKKKKRYLLLLILLSFVITFAIIRIITHLQKLGVLPNQNGPVHFHHMILGIILLIITGFISIGFCPGEKSKQFLAISYGAAAALTIDEFALWLFLKDVYWTEQGRDSVDAIVIFVVLAAIVFILSEMYDHRFLLGLKKVVKK